MEILIPDGSPHLASLLLEGPIRLDSEQERKRQAALFNRLVNPYFSLPGFARVCRHGPLEEDGKCRMCERDKKDAMWLLGS